MDVIDAAARLGIKVNKVKRVSRFGDPFDVLSINYIDYFHHHCTAKEFAKARNIYIEEPTISDLCSINHGINLEKIQPEAIFSMLKSPVKDKDYVLHLIVKKTLQLVNNYFKHYDDLRVVYIDKYEIDTRDSGIDLRSQRKAHDLCLQMEKGIMAVEGYFKSCRFKEDLKEMNLLSSH